MTGSDYTPIAIALIGAIPPTLMALASLVVSLRNGMKVTEIHKLTNSMKDQLVESSKAQSFLEGHAEGVKDEKIITAARSEGAEKGK